MNPADRRKKILEYLSSTKDEVRVETLAAVFAVSQLTIRRDLDLLTTEKTVIRTHGGVAAIGRTALESEYHRKVALNYDLKQQIARRAVIDILPGETILVNDGSTTYHLVSQFDQLKDCLVYTNSLAMISEFNRLANVRFFVLGGEYDARQFALSGSLTEKIVSMLYFDRLYLGCDALGIDGHCMVQTADDARLTETMIQHAKRRYLLADHTKIGATAHVRFGHLSAFDALFTSSGIAADHLAQLQTHTSVVIAR